MPLCKYKPTLQIGGDDIPLSAFNFSAPAGSLGVTADVTIADRSLTFSRGDSFKLTLRHYTGSTPKTNLIKDGRVSGDTRNVGITRVGGVLAPNDSYDVKGVDQIAEKWKITTRKPIILFNPELVTLQDNETDSNVNDANGNRIYAQTIEIADLDLIQLLNFVYVEKLGFSEVIHNLPNYALPRVDFGLNSSLHNTAKAFYGSALFNPVVFEFDNKLFILDIYGEMPEGIISGARTVNAAKYIAYSKTNPDLAIVNAVLLSHKEISLQGVEGDEFPENVTHRTETDPPHDVGTYGTVGWQRTTVTRFIAEIHDDAEHPEKVTSDIIWRVETRTQGRDDHGIVRDLIVETQTELYTNSWRLKVGYRKETTAYVDDGNGNKSMQSVQSENGTILWRPVPGIPAEAEKFFALIQVEGLVVVEGDEEGAPEDVLKTPLLEASLNGRVPDDGSAAIKRLPISTTTQVWRDTGPDQIQVLVTKLDQLTGRPDSSGTTEHVGTNRVRVRDGEAVNTRQVLIIDEASDETDGPREPISFDGGYLPYAVAKELALRALEQARNPRATISCQLAKFDGGIRRGSIRTIVDRDGNEVTAIITGYTVKGTPHGRGLIVISQSIEGVVIG